MPTPAPNSCNATIVATPTASEPIAMRIAAFGELCAPRITRVVAIADAIAQPMQVIAIQPTVEASSEYHATAGMFV